MNTNIHWESTMKVGSDLIDNQHKILFDLIKDLNNAIGAGVNIRTLDVLMGVLRDYALMHFQAEEECFKRHTEYMAHCLEHYKLVKKLNSFIVDFRNSRTKSDLVPSDFLEHWLLDHIESYDKPYLAQQQGELRLMDASVHVDEFEPDPKERRNHKRIPHNEVVDGEINTLCYNATQLKSGKATLVNMSPGGLMLQSARNHQVDDLLIVSCSIGLTFKMKEKVKVISARGQQYGVQFISPTPETVAFFTELYGSLHLNTTLF